MLHKWFMYATINGFCYTEYRMGKMFGVHNNIIQNKTSILPQYCVLIINHNDNISLHIKIKNYPWIHDIVIIKYEFIFICIHVCCKRTHTHKISIQP